MTSSNATSPREGNLSQWVSTIQDRHRGSGDITTPEPSKSASSAAELEEEIRRSREERAKRRSQTVGVVSAVAGETNSSYPSSQVRSSTDMKTAYAPPSLISSSPPKRSNLLLDRYGGAAGPTGVAKAGSKDSPASLASFMGGKASGPRLGKLEGDGRTTPPEAALVDYTSRRPLPGMASGGGLASFLEARASGQERIASIRPSSPTKASYLSSTVARPSPTRNDSGDQQTLTAVTTQTTNTSLGQRYDRGTSPLKESQISAAKELPASQGEVERLRSAATATESLVPASVVHSPTSDAIHHGSSYPPASVPSMGASPAFKATQQASDRMPTASLTRLRSKKMVEQRVREAQDRAGSDPSPSPTISPALRSTPAWMPSAQENSGENTEVEAGAGIKARWPATDKQPSPTVERKTIFTPSKFGNALPGMGQPRTGPPRNLYASNNRGVEDRSEVYSPPVRLPGMGSAQSPFAVRQAAMESDQSQEISTQPLERLNKGRAKPKRTARTSEAAEKATTTTTTEIEPQSEEKISREEFSAARDTFNHSARPASPRKPQLHLSLEPQTPTHPSRQDSMPSSADKRLADSTAALEALLEGKQQKTPTLERSKMAFIPDRTKRTGTLRIAQNKDSHITVDSSIIHRAPAKKAEISSLPKSISVEVMSIKPDGSSQILQGEEARVLYDTETQVIVHRFKESMSGGSVVTRIYARTGIRSRLLVDPSCLEARKVQEIGKQHATVVVDARQGRESVELVRILGGCLITREGSRKEGERDATCMYQVRGMEGAHYIDQVDMLSSSLCSAHSAIIMLQGDAFVWHGIGSSSSLRKTALQYARSLSNNSKGRSSISEYEEGEEDELFWTCFDKSVAYSDAWHHRFRPLLPENELQTRLYSIQGAGSSKRLAEQSDFSLVDVRRDGIHILQLPLEIYVLIGPEARSKRKEIHACINAASILAKDMSHRRGPTIMAPPLHVVVFPTIPPRELKSAFRYWHDEHLNGKGWQRAGLGMNVWEKRSALEQLECNEFQLWQVNDELFLPVGVGLEDVQGIDV